MKGSAAVAIAESKVGGRLAPPDSIKRGKMMEIKERFQVFPMEEGFLMLDIKTSRFYRCSFLVVDILDLLKKNLREEEIEKKLKYKYNEIEIKQALTTFKKIYTDNIRVNRAFYNLNKESLGTINLHITDKCSLACEYCYSKKIKVENSLDMPVKIGIKAVDFLLEESKERKKVICNFMGGEPLLKIETIGEIIDYAKSRASKKNKIIEFGLTTNGTLLAKYSDFLIKNFSSIKISIDGNKKTHDRFRKTKEGGGSFDIISSQIRMFLSKAKGKGEISARVTLCKEFPRFQTIISSLEKLGFNNIVLSPVTSNYSFSFDKKAMEKLENELRKYASDFLKNLGKKKSVFSNFINALRFLYVGGNKDFSCGAGWNLVGVDPEGKIFPCHRFVGIEKMSIGDLNNGFNEKRSFFINFNVTKRIFCKKCFARFICGGGCHYHHYLIDEKFYRPDFFYCEYIRLLVRLGIETISKMSLREREKFENEYLSDIYEKFDKEVIEIS